MKGSLFLSTLLLTMVTTAHAQVASSTPIPPICIGDCNGDGVVSINELVAGVGMALGNDVPGACLAFCFTLFPDIACIERAVNNVFNGCPTGCVTDHDCDAGNECVGSQCTASGCLYQCICD